MGHHHSHEHNHSYNISGKNLILTVLLNIFITVAQIIGGIISGSVALLTDALHNFSDVAALILTYTTNRISKRKSTTKQTFGFKRAEILAAFVNSAALIGISVFLITEAFKRFFNIKPIEFNIVIWFAFASIAANFISVLLLKKDAKESLNVKSAYLHLFTDVLTSIVVMTGGFLMKYYSIYWIDPLLSIIIAVYLLFSSYTLLVKTIKILMQFTPSGIDINKISHEITAIENIKNIHHVHIWQLDEKSYFMEAHIDVENDIKISGFQTILNNIEQILKKYNITHFNIQPEFERNDDKKIIVQQGH
jgi:cobalt-zinc-cadmium efflux system protein